MTLRILAMVEIICYNAVRQNVKGVHGDTKTPEVATPGFSIPFWEGVSAFYDFFFSHIH